MNTIFEFTITTDCVHYKKIRVPAPTLTEAYITVQRAIPSASIVTFGISEVAKTVPKTEPKKDVKTESNAKQNKELELINTIASYFYENGTLNQITEFAELLSDELREALAEAIFNQWHSKSKVGGLEWQG